MHFIISKRSCIICKIFLFFFIIQAIQITFHKHGLFGSFQEMLVITAIFHSVMNLKTQGFFYWRYTSANFVMQVFCQKSFHMHRQIWKGCWYKIKKRHCFNQLDRAVTNSSLGRKTINMIFPKDTTTLDMQCTLVLKCTFTPKIMI